MRSSLGLRDLESEFDRVLSEQLDLLVAVSLFVVVGPFVNVSLTVLQHAIDESGEAVIGWGALQFISSRDVAFP
jgi:hypothetical protein